MYTFIQTPTGGVMVRDEASSSVGSLVMALSWNVARGATNTVTVGTLPANARILSIQIGVPVVSNAATTATASVGLIGGTVTSLTAAQDVKTAIGNFVQPATVAWAASASSQSVTCTYTETGAASTAGTATAVITYCVL